MLIELYNRAAAQGAFKSLSSVPSAAPRSVPGFNSDAAVVSISQNLSSINVEKHIDDYQNGKGYLSKGISADLAKKNLENSINLAAQDPSSFTSYLLNSTALNYGSKARYIDSVSKAANAVNVIQTASEQDPGAEILEKFEALKAEQEQQGTQTES